MAGESLSLSELKDWYAKFDAVVKNYGGGALSTLGVPDGGTVVTSDINNLYNQITAFRNDTYFKTQPTLYATDYSIVSSGTTIIRNVVTPISTTITGIAKIKCRNDATNSSGTNSHGTNSHGTCAYSDNSQTCSRTCSVSCSHLDNSNDCSQTCSRSCSSGNNSNYVQCGNTCSRSCSHGDNSKNIDCSNTCSRTCSSGTHSQTCTRCAVSCARVNNWYSSSTGAAQNSNSTHGNSCSHGSNSNTCSRSCSYGDNSRLQDCSQTCSRTCTVSVADSHQLICDQQCTRSCSYGDNSNDCSQNCGNTCSRSCSHGDNSNTCSNSTYSHVTHGNVALSKTTVIDILNSLATKTNG